jgi:hypothetical protein
LFGAATFVIAFLLSGTLADYNASAAMPAKIVAAIETIQDTNEMVAIAHSDYDPAPLRTALGTVLAETVEWLDYTHSVADVEVALDRLNSHFATLLGMGLLPTVNRLQTEQSNIRLWLHQMAGIRNTDFLGPAYALLEFFLVGAIAALLLIQTQHFSESLVVSSLLFTSFTYLLLLIRDLDNPFDYQGQSSVDVDLGLLRKTRDRFLA